MEPLGVELTRGNSIVSPNDPLRKIDVTDLYQLLVNPPSELESAINQLRTILSINPKKYQELKRMLPYVTCGMFNPPYRRTANFTSIGCMIVDLDHLSQHGVNAEELKARLKVDPRVLLCFCSPSADGLKLLFKLSQKIYDAARYSMAYKMFITQFANQHGVAHLVDRVTSDVTRATFISIDANAYFNPNAEAVPLHTLINFDSPSSINTAQKQIQEFEFSLPPENTAPKEKNILPSDILQKIKESLNPNIKTKAEKIIYVPQELEPAVEKVKSRMQELGISVKQIENIHYGKKFVFELDGRFAQLNLFYGKQGYKVVVTPVRNADAELAEVSRLILCEIFM
ncbi:MAG: CRISPR-associated primase-polymerase type B [Tenuifilum sp.]|uniref:CRISPR-associated primase-polymerase type B n=1 Tax=Tenuifilum sp. TaxID=2760880 RepID=UPI001B6B179C|nr:hypothetical protein [Bacteroidales bacterium]HOK62038.1 CRISPR-associated primase-polymerase type B [Tenuifilum sp.]MBP9030302.1 hypothetical protein [Bacteroidales bacterium]HOK86830.1 CRISPR-associated primase-polymerase type B [Tenuifilum sp.]HON71446.1 CRISPR-associated primase-polymerase type B [Tenuifilum sp.]